MFFTKRKGWRSRICTGYLDIDGFSLFSRRKSSEEQRHLIYFFFSPWTSPALHSKDYHHHEKITSGTEKTKFACANGLGVFHQGVRLTFTNLYCSSRYRWIFSVFKREIEWGTTQVHCKSYHRNLRLLQNSYEHSPSLAEHMLPTQQGDNARSALSPDILFFFALGLISSAQ